MKKLLLALAIFASAFPLQAQNPRAKDFVTATDSLHQRLKRRTGVESPFKLEKVLTRGRELDFYFSQNLSAYPWRSDDVVWFRKQLQTLGKKALQDYSIGTIYANKQPLDELPTPIVGNNGKPLPTDLRVADPRNKSVPLVKGNDWWPLGLSGRHIALWQSHGYYWEAETDRWEWQRSPNHRTCEDVFTQSYVLPFLIPMLQNAGAVVMTPRERDTQENEVVCDNDPAFPGPRGNLVRKAGRYEETGNWKNAGTGFADAKESYSGYDNPFTMGTVRMTDTGDGSAKAIWRPDIPEKGEYAVYVSYKSVAGSTTDARYSIHHLGGETLLHVNQQMGGGTWIYLGTFLFDKGEKGYVELTNRSSVKGVVTADAVRFGGGMGKTERNGSVSGAPAYAEGALYSMQYGGTDLHLFDDWDREYTKDFAGRGKWVQELSGGSRVNPKAQGRGIPIDLSLAWHTDAGVTPNDSIIGTLAIYTLLCDKSDELPNGESRMNGRLYSDLVQTQVVNDIRREFEPQWTRRQLWDRSYSECRTTGVPGLLLELLSHLNFADMRYGLDPTFRFTAARSVYKGMLKYLSARYGCNYVVQPLPVHAFSVKLENGKALLSWQPTADEAEPTARSQYYRVYTRIDDAGFDAGYQVDSTSCTIPLEKGRLYSFKVTACNQGGESFPSEILCAGYPSADSKKVLVVNNFTRLSPPTWFDTPQYAGFTDQLDSGVPWGTDILFAGTVNQYDRSQVWTDDDNPGFGGSFINYAGSKLGGNTFDFTAAHGRVILDAGYAVESSSAEAFDGSSPAFALDLICGKQITSRVGRGAVPDRYPVFPEKLQTAIRSFTALGGNVVISGSYIGTDAWDSIYPGVPKGNDTAKSFIQEVLGYKWVTNYGDNGGIVDPGRGSKLPVASYNRDWNPAIYRVENPDGIQPASAKASTLMRYRVSRIPAATWYEAEGYKTAAFGFPLETSPEMGRILKTVLNRF